MTIEDLDASIKSLTGVVENLAIMTQKSFDEFRLEMKAEFANVYIRLDRIENILLRAHENRLERLEDDFRTVKTLLKIKYSYFCKYAIQKLRL